MQIPLGAKPPISRMWETGVAIASVILILLVVASIVYRPLIGLVLFGVFILFVAVSATICLGLYDSAREALDYSSSSNNILGYKM